ncbi:hypothetical protein ARALYDRAFT_899220 [Arabidopsis lyrata subsp. lyrata]|uniref:Uncharacterized protein n=1 Tax=Arabidopsis lyrata subsp. lyrata TaxID=81972 RepID=D7L7F9_ARALL|nr:hypothetical protein ARALYDRAFT_899220 [Arabidopsis lyrata subsp. lyrata]
MGSLIRECVGFQQFPVATQEKLIEYFGVFLVNKGMLFLFLWCLSRFLGFSVVIRR